MVTIRQIAEIIPHNTLEVDLEEINQNNNGDDLIERLQLLVGPMVQINGELLRTQETETVYQRFSGFFRRHNYLAGSIVLAFDVVVLGVVASIVRTYLR